MSCLRHWIFVILVPSHYVHTESRTSLSSRAELQKQRICTAQLKLRPQNAERMEFFSPPRRAEPSPFNYCIQSDFFRKP